MFLAKLIVISSILSYGVHYSMGLKCYDCTLRPCAPNNMTSALQVDCLANEKYCMVSVNKYSLRIRIVK